MGSLRKDEDTCITFAYAVGDQPWWDCARRLAHGLEIYLAFDSISVFTFECHVLAGHACELDPVNNWMLRWLLWVIVAIGFIECNICNGLNIAGVILKKWRNFFEAPLSPPNFEDFLYHAGNIIWNYVFWVTRNRPIISPRFRKVFYSDNNLQAKIKLYFYLNWL